MAPASRTHGAGLVGLELGEVVGCFGSGALMVAKSGVMTLHGRCRAGLRLRGRSCEGNGLLDLCWGERGDDDLWVAGGTLGASKR